MTHIFTYFISSPFGHLNNNIKVLKHIFTSLIYSLLYHLNNNIQLLRKSNTIKEAFLSFEAWHISRHVNNSKLLISTRVPYSWNSAFHLNVYCRGLYSYRACWALNVANVSSPRRWYPPSNPNLWIFTRLRCMTPEFLSLAETGRVVDSCFNSIDHYQSSMRRS